MKVRVLEVIEGWDDERADFNGELIATVVEVGGGRGEVYTFDLSNHYRILNRYTMIKKAGINDEVVRNDVIEVAESDLR